MADERNPIKAGWLTIRQAARVSGYKENYLRDMCRAGKIDAVVVDDTLWFVSESALREYLENSPRRPYNIEKTA